MNRVNPKNALLNFTFGQTDAKQIIKILREWSSDHSIQELPEVNDTVSWDLKKGKLAFTTITGITALTIENAQYGDQGTLIVTITGAGATLTYPANSMQLKVDITLGGDPVDERTRVGANKSYPAGIWSLEFIYTGEDFLWKVRKAEAVS